MPKKRVLFIINPASHIKQIEFFPEFIKKHLDTNFFEPHITHSKRAGFAKELALGAVRYDFDAVVAVGGDGTINEIANQLVGTKTKLGIIPTGSGNGLAKKLQIPKNHLRAMEVFNRWRNKAIDVGKINEHYFFSNAGIGFEALMCQKSFEEGKQKNGFWKYVKHAFGEFFDYQSDKYEISFGEQTEQLKAFSIHLSNSGYLGYDVGIAKHIAEIDDGKMELCITEQFPKWQFAFMASLLFFSKLKWSKRLKIHQVESAQIQLIESGKTKMLLGMDGEFMKCPNQLSVELIPKGLEVIVP